MEKEIHDPYQPPMTPPAEEPLSADAASLRKQLVPTWIKVFGWLFIVLGVTAPLGMMYSLISGEQTEYSLLGLEASGTVVTPTLLFLFLLFPALGLSAYGLLFGREWGLRACLGTGYLGLAIAIGTTAYSMASGMIVFRLEPLVQIPYLIKLHRIRKGWRRAGEAAE